MAAFLSGVMTSEQRASIRTLLGAADAATDLNTPNSTASTYALRYAATPTQSKEFIAAFLRGDMTSRQQQNFCAYIDTTFAGAISTDRPASSYGRERALFPIQIKNVIARFLAERVTDADQVVLRTLCCFDAAAPARVTLYLADGGDVNMNDPDMWHLESSSGPLAGRLPTWDDDAHIYANGERFISGSIQCHTLTVEVYGTPILTFTNGPVSVFLLKVSGGDANISLPYLYGSLYMSANDCYFYASGQYLSEHPQATDTTIVCDGQASQVYFQDSECDVYIYGYYSVFGGNCSGNVYLIGEGSSNQSAPAQISGTLYCIGKYTANYGQAAYGIFSGEGSHHDGGIYFDATFSGVGSYSQGGSYIYGIAEFSGIGAYNLGVCATVTFSGEDSYSGVGSYSLTAVYCGLRSRNLGWVDADAYFSGGFSENESLDGTTQGLVNVNSYAYGGSGKTGNRDIGGTVNGSRITI